MLNVYACVIYKSGTFKKGKYFQKKFRGFFLFFFFLQSLKMKFPWNSGFSF